uniref:Uncharacterized protein n=1 Tax=Populus davidiana TaxID=266767 RepID=A0A6M2F5N4_9ROSI
MSAARVYQDEEWLLDNLPHHSQGVKTRVPAHEQLLLHCFLHHPRYTMSNVFYSYTYALLRTSHHTRNSPFAILSPTSLLLSDLVGFVFVWLK